MPDDANAIRAAAFEALNEGKVEEAYARLSQILTTDECTLDDLYLAGEWALDAGLYQTAIDLFSRTINESESMKDSWYLDGVYLARAYARAQTGAHDLAKDDLALVPDGVELTWLRNHSALSKESVLALTNRP
jgi:tetratricopeptide (TPR) repeat protein